MAIQKVNGDVLSIKHGFIVHGCNAQGVMGSGVARGVKGRYPQAFEVYENALNNGGLVTGDISVAAISPLLFIVNAITQEGYGPGLQVQYSAVHAAFSKVQQLADWLNPNKISPICFPLIGAGRGGGDWGIISELIESVPWGKRQLLLFTLDQEPEYCR